MTARPLVGILPLMLTSAPLFDFANIPAALFGPAPDDVVLAAPWMRGGETPYWYSRTAWSLAMVARQVAARRERREVSFWLPDYFCNQSTDLLRRDGVRLSFYPVTDSLVPDWTACRALAGQSPPDVFVVVHYFGQACGDGARAFADDTGAVLVEDAAHALGPAPGIGEDGDVVCYSPHKLFALPHGALMLVRDESKIGKIDPAPNLQAPEPATWFGRRIVQAAMPAALLHARTARSKVAYADDPAYAPIDVPPPVSHMARRLIARALPNIPDDGRSRHANYAALAACLATIDGIEPLFAPIGAPPYRLAWRADCHATAEALFRSFKRNGCPVEAWPDMPPEVLAAPERHGPAISLRQTVLTFPVHQTITPESYVRCRR